MRVVISFTTSPKRLEACGEMVRVLRGNHRHMADAELRLLMPRFFGRSREPFDGAMPRWWDAEAARPGPRMVFVVVEDLGPATKILGNLHAEEQEGWDVDSHAVYISVDDDQAYGKGMVDQLLVHHRRSPGCVLCYTGVRLLGSGCRYIADALNETDLSLRPSAAALLDLPEGFGGVLYPRSVLLGLSPLRDALMATPSSIVPDFAVRGDDYLLSNALANLGVPRLAVVHTPHAPGPTCKDMIHGLQADALHKIDGSEPAARYRPIMEWASSNDDLPRLLRDAFPRTAVAPADLALVTSPGNDPLSIVGFAAAAVLLGAALAALATLSPSKAPATAKKRILMAVFLAAALVLVVVIWCSSQAFRNTRPRAATALRQVNTPVVIGVPSRSAAEWLNQLRRGSPLSCTIVVLEPPPPGATARPRHPALALLEQEDARAPAADGTASLLVTLPEGEAGAPASLAEVAAHLNHVVARARQLPQCVVAAEASLVVRDGASSCELHPCPPGCAASIMDSEAGVVAYPADVLRKANLSAAQCHTDADLSAALTSAGVTILRLPDPAATWPAAQRRTAATISPAAAALLNTFERAG
jgi:hypothetical protein